MEKEKDKNSENERVELMPCLYGPPEMMFRRRPEAEKALRRVEVSAAIVVKGGAILATQRGYGKWKGWWEFPGGKIEPGESREEALLREMREEMEAAIVIDSFFQTVDYDYDDFHLTMHCFLCFLPDGSYRLKEHLDARWVTPEEFSSLQWLPADDEVLNNLKSRL